MTIGPIINRGGPFSYLRVSEKGVIFDLFPFCLSTYQYSNPMTIRMALKDGYEWRIMPLLEGFMFVWPFQGHLYYFVT